MKGIRTRRLLLTLGVVVLVATAGMTAVFAQEGEVEPLPNTDPENGAEEAAPLGFYGHHFGGKRSFGFGQFGGALEGTTPRGQALADALEIPLEELEEAKADAHANWIAEMVASGYMDQEQADLMLAYNALNGSLNRHALTAQSLGLSEDALTAAREEGKTLAKILEEAGLSIEDFMSVMQEAYEAAVQAEVGQSITQAQADLILENGTGPGYGQPGFGGRGGFGMGQGHGLGRGSSHGFSMNRGSGMGHGLGRGFGPGTQGSSFGPAFNDTGL